MANLIGGLLVNVFCVNINFDKLVLFHAMKSLFLNSWALGLDGKCDPLLRKVLMIIRENSDILIRNNMLPSMKEALFTGKETEQ